MFTFGVGVLSPGVVVVLLGVVVWCCVFAYLVLNSVVVTVYLFTLTGWFVDCFSLMLVVC